MMWDFILRLFVAGILGAVVGLDREYRAKEAGYRTHFLVSLGSALIMVVSQYGFQDVILENSVSLDPSRVAAQVVSGIGFIGAGTIIIQKQFVRGLTTAAGIWMVAALGLAVGVGLYWVAVISTVLILFTLVSLEQYERHAKLDWEGRIIHLRAGEIVEDLERYKQLLGQYNVALHNVLVEYDYGAQKTDLKFVVLARSTTDFISLFARMRNLYRTEYISLQNEI